MYTSNTAQPIEYHRGAISSGSGQPGRCATSRTACAANPKASIVSAWCGSRRSAAAAGRKKPIARATSKPTPSCASWATASPTYAPADMARSSAMICASRSSENRRSGELAGIIEVRTACHVSPSPTATNATSVVRKPSVTPGEYSCLMGAPAALASAIVRVERLRLCVARAPPTRCAKPLASAVLPRLHVIQRVDSIFGRIDWRHDRGRFLAGSRRLPQVAVVRQIETCAVVRKEHADARAVRVGRVHFRHHRDLAGRQPHQVAGGVDAEQLDESPHQVLIELRAVVALEHREDAIGRVRLLIRALRAHGVVDV